MTSAEIDYRVHMEVIECNTEVAMETIGEARNLIEAKTKMAESWFTSSDEKVVDQLKLRQKKALLNKHKYA